MAYTARSVGNKHVLPDLKARIVGGRLVTTLEAPKPIGSQSPKAADRVNQYDPRDLEQNLRITISNNGVLTAQSGDNHSMQSMQSETARSSQQTTSSLHVAIALYAKLQEETKDSYLPRRPLQLSDVEQVALIYEIDQALHGQTNTNALKQCYLELTTFDRQLTGSVQFNQLVLVLSRNKVILPVSLLRLIASLFVVEQAVENTVNYEKLLSFLGACFRRISENSGTPRGDMITTYQQTARAAKHDTWQLKSVERIGSNYCELCKSAAGSAGSVCVCKLPLPSDAYHVSNRPVYYESNCSPRNAEPALTSVSVREVSRAKRLGEEYLRQSNRKLCQQDFEDMRNSFVLADRLVRRALSEAHIKEICHQHRFPLPDFVLEEIIRTCCTHRGGGQYDWEQFVDFLEKLQPVNTSLQVGYNQQPQGRRPPSPVASWPHAEALVLRDSSHFDREQNVGAPLIFRRSEPASPALHPSEVLLQFRQQLLDSKGREWLAKFEQFASALFLCPETSPAGLLRQPEVLLVTKAFNDKTRLLFSQLDIDFALRRAKVPDGRIDLSAYLNSLARGNSDAQEAALSARLATFR